MYSDIKYESDHGDSCPCKRCKWVVHKKEKEILSV